MTKAEQKAFIVELISNVEVEMLRKVSDMPDEWDGHELRQYIADRFAQVVVGSYMTNKRSARYRAYRNVMITTNL